MSEMGTFAPAVIAASVALATAPCASAKEFRSLAVVGARGDSVTLQAAEGLIDSFFDGASRFNRARKPEPRAARGGYVRLYPLGTDGFVGIPGRFYPGTQAACFDWLQWRRPRDCSRPNAELLRLLVPAARRLTHFAGVPTTVVRLAQPRLTPRIRRQLHVAFELAFDRSRSARSGGRPSRCVAFSARWRGPTAESRPRRFCLSRGGAYASGRLYPLGPGVWSLVELNLSPARRSRSAGRGPAGLPAPVAFETARAVHTLLEDGRIAVRPARRERCGGTTSMLVAGEGACLVSRDGRVAVLRNGDEVWRSTRRYRLSGTFAKLGPEAVAFSYDRYDGRSSTQTLFLSRLGARERAIARDERPLGWTRAGELLTWRSGQGAAGVYLRASDGTRRRRLAAGLAEIRFDTHTQAVFMLSRSGLLFRFDGRHRERLASVRSLGFGRHPTITLLDGGLIGVLDRSRIAVLRSDGSLFARARFRVRGRRVSVAGNSGLVANAAGTAVAFTVTHGNTGYRSVGRESIYVLREGDRQPSRRYSHRLRFAPCTRWTHLSWLDDWLLYAPTEGKTVAIDTTRAARRIDLTRVATRIGGRRADRHHNVQVRWSRRAS